MTKIIQGKEKLGQLGIYLMRKGGLYKDDLLLYANTRVCKHSSDASDLLKQLRVRGILDITDFNLKRRQRTPADSTGSSHSYMKQVRTVQVCRLTDFGQQAMYAAYRSEKLDEALPRSYFDNIRAPFLKDTSKLSKRGYKNLVKLYDANRLKVFFNCLGGVKTEKDAKPSLEQIFAYRNGISYTPAQGDGYKYYDNASALAMDLSRGFYYTIDEYRQFYSQHEDGVERFNTIARGIYISNLYTLVVYANGKGNSNMIYCPFQSSDNQIIQSLKYERLSFNLTDADNNLLAQSVQALALGEAKSFVISTATGKRYGRNTKGHKSDNYLKKILTAYSPLFTDIGSSNVNVIDEYDSFYAATLDKDGITQIKDLIYNKKSSSAYYNELIENYGDTFKENKDLVYPLTYMYEDYRHPCLVMHAYELMTLKMLAKSERRPIILTRKSMMDVIQRITRKQYVLVDMDTLDITGADQTSIYDSNGYNAGKKILEDYLMSKELKASVKEYRELPKKFNKTYIEFYNDLADEVTSPEDYIELMETTPYVKTRKRATIKKSVSVSSEIYEQIKQKAQRDHVTIYHVVNQIMKRAFKELQ